MKALIHTTILIAALTMAGCDEDETASDGPFEPRTKKLAYYTQSFESGDDNDLPRSKVEYQYDGDRVSKYSVYVSDPTSGTTSIVNYFVFFYNGDQLNKIEGYQPGKKEPYVTDTYEYLANGKVSRITDVNTATAVTGVVNFTYDNDLVKTAYTLSNGGSFEYEFNYTSQNVISDKTTRGAQLCSSGDYTYDDHINPLSNLGYVDYLLTTLSKNNKLTESVSYVGCAFPSLIPVAYTYEYNSDRFPTIAITTYKGDSEVRSVRKFFYR